MESSEQYVVDQMCSAGERAVGLLALLTALEAVDFSAVSAAQKQSGYDFHGIQDWIEKGIALRAAVKRKII